MTYARISSRERKDFFRGVRSFRPVISLILLRTSSAAAINSASDVAFESPEGEATAASCPCTRAVLKRQTAPKNRTESLKGMNFTWEAMFTKSMTKKQLTRKGNICHCPDGLFRILNKRVILLYSLHTVCN